MIYTKTDEKIRVEAGTYTLEVTAENIAVILAGERVALLRPGSAVNVLKADGEIGEDKAEGALTCSFADKRDADGSYVFTWTGKSANWEKKEYVVRAKENCFEYFVRVTGKGDVDSVKYFIGDCGDWLCGSEYDFDTGYMPIPTVNGASQCEFSAQCSYDEFSYLTVVLLHVRHPRHDPEACVRSRCRPRRAQLHQVRISDAPRKFPCALLALDRSVRTHPR